MNDITTATRYVVGLDLGQRHDYTAVSVLRQHAVPTGRMVRPRGAVAVGGPSPPPRLVPETAYHYDCVYLDRWRDRSYQDLVPAMTQLMELIEAGTREAHRDAGLVNQDDLPVRIVVDYTGVGLAVVDILRAHGIRCTGVTITGGTATTRAGGDYRVPKRELVSQLQVLAEARRFTVAEALPLASVLTTEMQNFRSSTKLSTGHDSYGVGEEWREGHHDDLVLATAIAGWFGEHVRERGKMYSA